MTRGTYGPLDRDRHLVIGWGADQLVSYARDRTVGAALRPVLPAISTTARAGRAVNQLRIGMQIGGRDEAQKPPAVVGHEFFHTIADRLRAIATLTTYFRTFASDLATWQEENKDKPTARISARWLDAEVTPTLKEWRGFVEQQQQSWWARAATSWETYEKWWDRLRQLRGLARAHGISLQSTEPLPLPKTLWQRGAEGKGTEATALLGVLKVGVVAALSITGAVSLYKIVRDLRSRGARGIDVGRGDQGDQ